MRFNLLLCGSVSLAWLSGGGVLAQTSGNYAEPYYVSVFAGANAVGSVDGRGDEARFSAITGIAWSGLDLVVLDAGNGTVRLVETGGFWGSVKTIAGKAGNFGTTDGPGADARFRLLHGAAFAGSSDELYVTDSEAHTVRKVTMSYHRDVVTVSTFAGKPDQWGDSNGGGAAGGLIRPMALAANTAGELFVSEGDYTIRKISRAGEISLYAGKYFQRGVEDASLATARFAPMVDFSFDRDGSLFMSDWNIDHAVVRKITPQGQVLRVAGVPHQQGQPYTHANGPGKDVRFSVPFGLVAGQELYVFVVDSDAGVVRRIDQLDSQWRMETYAGQPLNPGFADGSRETARFYMPTDIARRQGGTLYIADRTCIREIGNEVRTIAGMPYPGTPIDGSRKDARFQQPRGVAVAANGDVYVTDMDAHAVRKISAGGPVTTFAGKIGVGGYQDGAAADARFSSPIDLAFDASGNLYVLEAGNFRLRKITPEGIVSTLAGSGVRGWKDGQGLEAGFSEPRGLAVDRAGNIYVGDSSAVRKVTRGGMVTTLNGFPEAAANVGIKVEFHDVAVDAADTLYALFAPPSGGWKIVKRLASGTFSTVSIPLASVGTGALGLDASGRLFVGGPGYLGRLDNDGFKLLAGRKAGASPDPGFGENLLLNQVGGLAVDGQGAVYFSSNAEMDKSVRRAIFANAPAISVQPVSQTVTTGARVELSVTATGIPVPKHQWKKFSSDVPNATSPTLVIASAAASDEGNYTVTVSNEAGSVTSSVAIVRVVAGGTTTPPPSTGGGGGNSGGGGAPSHWFVSVLSVLALVRAWTQRRTVKESV